MFASMYRLFQQVRWYGVMCLLTLAPYAAANQVQAFVPSEFKIAADSHLKIALEEVVRLYRAEHPLVTVEITYGPSGKIFQQIQQGVAFDVYFSADTNYPAQLVKSKHTADPVRIYGVGKLVLYSQTHQLANVRLEQLAAMTHIKKIAIPHPKHAPYGQRAIEALQAAGIYKQIESKLMYSEDSVHALQLVQTGQADLGMIAFGLLHDKNQALPKNANYVFVTPHLHQPLSQGFVLTRKGAQNPDAVGFTHYVQQPKVRTIMAEHGFTVSER